MRVFVCKKDMPFVKKWAIIVDRVEEGNGYSIFPAFPKRCDVTFDAFFWHIVNEHFKEYFSVLNSEVEQEVNKAKEVVPFDVILVSKL